VDLHRLNHLAPCPLNQGRVLNLCVPVCLPNQGKALNLCALIHLPRFQGSLNNSRMLALSCPIQELPILSRLPGRNSLVCHRSNRQPYSLVCLPNQPGIIRIPLALPNRSYVLLPLLMRVGQLRHPNLFTRSVLFQDHVKLSGMDLLWMTFITIQP
jgi:hypothetical protein